MKLLNSIIAVAVIGGSLAGCAATDADKTSESGLISDPYQGTNREIHSFNVGVDRAVLKPAAEAYDAVTPPFGKYVVANAVNTLKMPRIFANKVLQGDLEGSLTALMRFSMNAAFGAGGLLDPATEMGLPLNDTDFGVTLAKYGVEEGVYLELPFLGPRTSRDAAGMVVDLAFDPLIYISGVPGEVNYGVRAVEAVNFRHQNAGAIDHAFYESDDSYVTTKAAYVQTRRRAIAGETTEESLPSVFDNN